MEIPQKKEMITYILNKLSILMHEILGNVQHFFVLNVPKVEHG